MIDRSRLRCIFVLMIMCCFHGCTWNQSFQQDPAGVSRSGQRSAALSVSGSRLVALRSRAQQRADKVNYSNVIDPTANKAASIAAPDEAKVIRLLQSKSMSSIGKTIEKCNRNPSSTASSSCSDANMKRMLQSWKSSIPASIRPDSHNFANSLSSVCSRCQGATQIQKVCPTQTNVKITCPTCSQVLQETHYYDTIMKQMKKLGLVSTVDKVNCLLPSARKS